ncbi:unnamed protein product, partial [marine sediment metagenome]
GGVGRGCYATPSTPLHTPFTTETQGLGAGKVAEILNIGGQVI